MRSSRRDPEAQAGRAEADRGLPERSFGQRGPRGDGGVRGGAAGILSLRISGASGDAGAMPTRDNPKPWALGYGSALSDYLGQAYMTQICKPKPGEITLEVGNRQRVPEQPAVADRGEILLDRDYRAAGQGGGERSSRRSATTTCIRGSATATMAGRRSWAAFDIVIVTMRGDLRAARSVQCS